MKSSDWTIRLATSQDAEAVVELVNAAYRGESGRKGWTTESDILGGQRVDRERICEQINSNDSRIILALDASRKIVGCVHVEKTASPQGAPACYLGMLTADVRIQAKGLGSFLMSSAEDYARREFRAKLMSMTVISVRAELIAWYERRGYTRTGETKPFPYGNERFGIPLRTDLVFAVLEKPL
jgi:GNAT superfamily N-acetyltransferase